MYKIRIKFTKNDYMIFISHLDLYRMIERALRRGKVPLSFSQGFNPHPKISFATALALGVSSDGEYIDIEVYEKIDLEVFKRKMNEELPKGVRILACKYINMKSESLTNVVEYSTYVVKCKLEEVMKKEAVDQAIQEFMKREEIIVEKTVKKIVRRRKVLKKKEMNIRPLINHIEIMNKDHLELLLKLTLATGNKGSLRPEVLLQKLNEIGNIPILQNEIRIHRVDLYGVKNSEFITPLELTI